MQLFILCDWFFVIVSLFSGKFFIWIQFKVSKRVKIVKEVSFYFLIDKYKGVCFMIWS